MALVGQRGDHDHAAHAARHHVVEEGALVFRIAVGVADDDAVTEMTPGIGLDLAGDHAVARVAERRHQQADHPCRSEEHTSELQSLMRNSYAVFCLQKKKYNRHTT